MPGRITLGFHSIEETFFAFGIFYAGRTECALERWKNDDWLKNRQ